VASSFGNPAQIAFHFVGAGKDWASCLTGGDSAIRREFQQADPEILKKLKPGLPNIERLLSRSSDGPSKIRWRMLSRQVFLKFFDLRDENSGYLAFVIMNYFRRFFQFLRQRFGSFGFTIEFFKSVALVFESGAILGGRGSQHGKAAQRIAPRATFTTENPAGENGWRREEVRRYGERIQHAGK